MSPLLFFIFIDGLSRLIGNAKEQGNLHGIRISRSLFLSHILFVDGFLLFGNGDVQEWLHFADIINLLCLAFGMEVTQNKSCFIALNEDIDSQIIDILPYSKVAMDDGFTYLGFSLKPNGYNIKDWQWLFDKVEKKLGL